MSRPPTDAEQRAFLAVQEEITRQFNDRIDPAHRVDMMTLIRVVIRSLKEPTPEMMAAMTWALNDGVEEICAAAIDAASPEIKS